MVEKGVIQLRIVKIRNHCSMIASELEAKLKSAHIASFHYVNFASRHQFDLVVYMDQSSTVPGQTPALKHLVEMVQDFEITKVLKRTPALMVGGLDSWLVTIKTSAVRVIEGVGFGDTDGTAVAEETYNNVSENPNEVSLAREVFIDMIELESTHCLHTIPDQFF
jgi:hypothetical protein